MAQPLLTLTPPLSLEYGHSIPARPDSEAAPYAPGAAGNLATDDLVYFLERQGIATGVDRAKLARASLPILRALGRAPSAKSQQAQLASDA